MPKPRSTVSRSQNTRAAETPAHASDHDGFSLDALIQSALGHALLCGTKSEPAPLTAAYEPGGNLPLLLITGSNASGKSLLSKLLSHRANKDWGLDLMRVGMDIRTTSSGLRRAFVFGGLDEDESAGALSVHACLKVFSCCQSKEDRHLVVLDEPDVGLSEEYAAALGQRIARFATAMPATTQALIVVTHSRYLARELRDLSPAHIRTGDELALSAWLDTPPVASSLDDLETLNKRARSRYNAVERTLRASRSAR